jgi:hypothetical protein
MTIENLMPNLSPLGDREMDEAYPYQRNMKALITSLNNELERTLTQANKEWNVRKEKYKHFIEGRCFNYDQLGEHKDK